MGGWGGQRVGQWGGGHALPVGVGEGRRGGRLGSRGGRTVPCLGREHRPPGGGERVGGGVVWQAGRGAGRLKEVAAKVHRVAGAMMAGVPEASGVKILGCL